MGWDGDRDYLYVLWKNVPRIILIRGGVARLDHPLKEEVVEDMEAEEMLLNRLRVIRVALISIVMVIASLENDASLVMEVPLLQTSLLDLAMPLKLAIVPMGTNAAFHTMESHPLLYLHHMFNPLYLLLTVMLLPLN